MTVISVIIPTSQFISSIFQSFQSEFRLISFIWIIKVTFRQFTKDELDQMPLEPMSTKEKQFRAIVSGVAKKKKKKKKKKGKKGGDAGGGDEAAFKVPVGTLVLMKNRGDNPFQREQQRLRQRIPLSGQMYRQSADYFSYRDNPGYWRKRSYFSGNNTGNSAGGNNSATHAGGPQALLADSLKNGGLGGGGLGGGGGNQNLNSTNSTQLGLGFTGNSVGGFGFGNLNSSQKFNNTGGNGGGNDTI
jgi:hypothetical protein